MYKRWVTISTYLCLALCELKFESVSLDAEHIMLINQDVKLGLDDKIGNISNTFKVRSSKNLFPIKLIKLNQYNHCILDINCIQLLTLPWKVTLVPSWPRNCNWERYD